VAEFRGSGANQIKLRVDGSEVISLATGVVLGAIDRITVGRHGDSSPSNPYTGLISEIGVYSKQVSGDELTDLETYLANGGFP
jgi:hypothetical protein